MVVGLLLLQARLLVGNLVHELLGYQVSSYALPLSLRFLVLLLRAILGLTSTGSEVSRFLQVVSREIRRILQERATSFNIALDDVSITNLTFGREFTAAIEAKQVAAQEAERAKFVVEKAEQDKRSAIIRAQVSYHH